MNRNFRLILATTLTTALLTGCASYNTRNYEQINPKNATILINSDRIAFNGQLGAIQDAFRDAGWKVYAVKLNKTKLQGLVSNGRIDVTKSHIQKAHYWLSYDWSPNISDPAIEPHLCMTAMDYSISIIDLRTDQTAFSMSGTSCGAGIVENMREWLAKHRGAY